MVQEGFGTPGQAGGIRPGPAPLGRAGWIPLGALYAVTALAILGFAMFAVNPASVQWNPTVAAVYAASFTGFARAHVLLAFGALALHLAQRAGARWLGAFAAVYIASLASELLGTTVGLPFGPYQYTDALGWKWFAHVPVLIPLSWFYMAVPSYALALRAFATPAARALFGSLVLLVWDLSLDPAMSFATKYWVWGSEGPYYGMPLLNLFGWYATGLALMGLLAALRAESWVARLDARWLALFYLANTLLPIGLSAAAGLWGAVAACAGATALCVAVARVAPALSRAAAAGASAAPRAPRALAREDAA